MLVHTSDLGHVFVLVLRSPLNVHLVVSSPQLTHEDTLLTLDDEVAPEIVGALLFGDLVILGQPARVGPEHDGKLADRNLVMLGLLVVLEVGHWVMSSRRAYNKVYVERTPEDKYEYMAEIRSMNEQGSSILIQLKINTITKELFFSLPYIKAKSLLPAGLVFKALGISEDDMKRMVRIGDPDILDTLAQQHRMEVTMEEAIESIANDITDEMKDSMYVRDILNKELFYHVGALTPEKSAYHLGYIIKKLVDTVYNGRSLDDKDNLANKRIDGTSSLMSFLFQILFKQFVKTVSNQMESQIRTLWIIKDIKTIIDRTPC